MFRTPEPQDLSSQCDKPQSNLASAYQQIGTQIDAYDDESDIKILPVWSVSVFNKQAMPLKLPLRLP